MASSSCRTRPSRRVGHLANLHVLSTIMHLTKPVELADNWERAESRVRESRPSPIDGRFDASDGARVSAWNSRQTAET